jgi:tRNA modification GTPase
MNASFLQLTGRGMGAIAVIALTGPDARAVLLQLLPATTLDHATLGHSARALLHDPKTHTPIDDALLLRTAEHTYELHLHGGIAVVDSVLHALTQAGASPLSIPDALQQNLLGSLLQAEISVALSTATTLTAVHLLAAQAAEGLAAWSRHWHSWLIGKTPNDLWHFHSAVQWLITRSHTLSQLLHPPRVAIIGPPNAGKSTLANTLLGRPIAITSAIAGTTRDWVDAQATFLHAATGTAVPITLVDTAGVRSTDDPLEKASIARTHQQADQADLLILLFDGSSPSSSPDHFLHTNYLPARTLPIANKIDAGRAGTHALLQRYPGLLHISAKENHGIDTLMNAVLEKLDLASVHPTEPFAFTPRHHQLLEQLALTDSPVQAAALLQSLTPDAAAPSA